MIVPQLLATANSAAATVARASRPSLLASERLFSPSVSSPCGKWYGCGHGGLGGGHDRGCRRPPELAAELRAPREDSTTSAACSSSAEWNTVHGSSVLGELLMEPPTGQVSSAAATAGYSTRNSVSTNSSRSSFVWISMGTGSG